MSENVMLISLFWLALQIPLSSLVGRFIKYGSGKARIAESRPKFVPFYVANEA
jgi:hypothetical protein